MNLASAQLMAFVPVGDVARARAFYEGVLGCSVEQEDDYGCALVSNGSLVRLARMDDDTRASGTALGWLVPNIAEAVDTLAGLGANFQHYEGMGQDGRGVWLAPSGDRVAWFADSEGNTLSLTQSA